MKFYLTGVLLGILFSSTGVRALRKPAPFHHTNGNGSPYYESKNATKSEELWNLAQKMYGVHMLTAGICYILLLFALHPLYLYILTHVWKHESRTVPFFCVILIPLMLLIGIANALVELRLKKYERRG